MTADPHEAFGDAFTPTTRQDPEERRRLIASIAAV